MKIKKQSDDFRNYVMEQLDALPDLHMRRMFGGHGIYQGEYFFAIVHDGRMYFKTTPITCLDYEGYGMEPFSPRPNQRLKNYYEVPLVILEDTDELTVWARRAIQVAKDQAK